jgi:hypothetical protein
MAGGDMGPSILLTVPDRADLASLTAAELGAVSPSRIARHIDARLATAPAAAATNDTTSGLCEGLAGGEPG